MKIGQKKMVEVEAKILKLHLKVCDMFCATLCDQDGEEIFEQDDGYVPEFMPEQHHGDYVMLNIDIETGQITNWIKPSEADLQKWINKEDDA